jgi:hypothetical protein
MTLSYSIVVPSTVASASVVVGRSSSRILYSCSSSGMLRSYGSSSSMANAPFRGFTPVRITPGGGGKARSHSLSAPAGEVAELPPVEVLAVDRLAPPLGVTASFATD